VNVQFSYCDERSAKVSGRRWKQAGRSRVDSRCIRSFSGVTDLCTYARDITGRLADFRAGPLLETAAGTGIVTRALAANLQEAVVIDATDLNQAMVDHAAGLLPSPRVTWRQADAQALPFPDAMFDAVVCQFGVMFFPDIVKAFSETHRVLRPGGRFVFNVWDRIEANDFAHVTVQAVAALFPEDPPFFLARTPRGHRDTTLIEMTLHRAAFDGVTVETVTKKSTASSPGDPALGFCQGTPMRNEMEARDPTRREEATDVAAAAIASRFGTGPMAGQMKAYVITARPIGAP
jgi:ubiquinone/menaquinone biosynthesis C-methylase UbiE